MKDADGALKGEFFVVYLSWTIFIDICIYLVIYTGAVCILYTYHNTACSGEFYLYTIATRSMYLCMFET